jgi:hypothetical protein
VQCGEDEQGNIECSQVSESASCGCSIRVGGICLPRGFCSQIDPS